MDSKTVNLNCLTLGSCKMSLFSKKVECSFNVVEETQTKSDIEKQIKNKKSFFHFNERNVVLKILEPKTSSYTKRKIAN